MTVVRLTLRAPRGLLYHWLSLLGASAGVHLAAILALVFLPRYLHPRMDFPDVYTVNLVSLPAGEPGPKVENPSEAKPAGQAPAPAPVPTPPTVKPKPAIKIPEKPTVKPPKTKPAAKPVPTPAKPRETEQAAESRSVSDEKQDATPDLGKTQTGGGSTPVSGSGTAGVAGGGGGGGVLDDSTFQYGWYLANMNSIFSRNWTRPIKPDLDHPLRAKVHFTIQKDGRLTDIVLEQSSGDPALDRSAIRAIQDSNPLPPLPYQYGKESLGVHFFFDLVPD